MQYPPDRTNMCGIIIAVEHDSVYVVDYEVVNKLLTDIILAFLPIPSLES